MKGFKIFVEDYFRIWSLIAKYTSLECVSFDVKCDAVTSQSTEMCSLLTGFAVLPKNDFSPMWHSLKGSAWVKVGVNVKSWQINLGGYQIVINSDRSSLCHAAPQCIQCILYNVYYTMYNIHTYIGPHQLFKCSLNAIDSVTTFAPNCYNTVNVTHGNSHWQLSCI